MSVQVKFIVDNKQPLNITATVNVGAVVMYVTLSPGMSGLAKWQTSCSAGKTCSINVLTTDPNLYIGAYYYIILQSASGSLNMALSLNQVRKADLIQTGFVYKGSFKTQEEQVMFYYFRPPKVGSFFRATLRLTALTPHFYPTVLVQKNAPNSAPRQPSQSLHFPNYGNYSYMFGDNFTSVVQ